MNDSTALSVSVTRSDAKRVLKEMVLRAWERGGEERSERKRKVGGASASLWEEGI